MAPRGAAASGTIFHVFLDVAWTALGQHRGAHRTRCSLSSYYQSKLSSEWKRIQQRIPITWTNCHFGGCRPWFVCQGYGNERCGRRVAILYGSAGLFACRTCHDLAYESQQQTPVFRALDQAQKSRMRLGASPDIFESLPEKPKRMHWRTYRRRCAQAKFATAYCNRLTDRWLKRSDKTGVP
jgi:hypothetical protein